MPKPKGATSLRLSDDAQLLLRGLAESLGTSKTAVLEIAIREKAKREGITLESVAPVGGAPE
jgi:predicted transcriptional regulator